MSTLHDALEAMDKATPGPWHLIQSNNATPFIMHEKGVDWTDVSDNSSLICHMPVEILEDYNSLNNARIIAAVPDALAIIKRMLPYIENALDEVKSVVEMGFFHSKALDAQQADLNDIIGQIKGDDALIARAKPEEVGR